MIIDNSILVFEECLYLFTRQFLKNINQDQEDQNKGHQKQKQKRQNKKFKLVAYDIQHITLGNSILSVISKINQLPLLWNTLIKCEQDLQKEIQRKRIMANPVNNQPTQQKNQNNQIQKEQIKENSNSNQIQQSQQQKIKIIQYEKYNNKQKNLLKYLFEQTIQNISYLLSFYQISSQQQQQQNKKQKQLSLLPYQKQVLLEILKDDIQFILDIIKPIKNQFYKYPVVKSHSQQILKFMDKLYPFEILMSVYAISISFQIQSQYCQCLMKYKKYLAKEILKNIDGKQNDLKKQKKSVIFLCKIIKGKFGNHRNHINIDQKNQQENKVFFIDFMTELLHIYIEKFKKIENFIQQSKISNSSKSFNISFSKPNEEENKQQKSNENINQNKNQIINVTQQLKQKMPQPQTIKYLLLSIFNLTLEAVQFSINSSLKKQILQLYKLCIQISKRMILENNKDWDDIIIWYEDQIKIMMNYLLQITDQEILVNNQNNKNDSKVQVFNNSVTAASSNKNNLSVKNVLITLEYIRNFRYLMIKQTSLKGSQLRIEKIYLEKFRTIGASYQPGHFIEQYQSYQQIQNQKNQEKIIVQNPRNHLSEEIHKQQQQKSDKNTTANTLNSVNQMNVKSNDDLNAQIVHSQQISMQAILNNASYQQIKGIQNPNKLQIKSEIIIKQEHKANINQKKLINPIKIVANCILRNNLNPVALNTAIIYDEQRFIIALVEQTQDRSNTTTSSFNNKLIQYTPLRWLKNKNQKQQKKKIIKYKTIFNLRFKNIDYLQSSLQKKVYTIIVHLKNKQTFFIDFQQQSLMKNTKEYIIDKKMKSRQKELTFIKEWLVKLEKDTIQMLSSFQ